MSRIDAILATALAAATLTISLYFAPRGFQGGFVDMAHDGYQLRQALDLSRGGVIFRDTFDQYGPLNGYLNTVGFLALGGRLLAMKYFICGWYALIAVALYGMARHWLSPALAAFSGFVWLALAPFYQHGVMLSPHVYALFFQTLATIVALRSPRLEARRLFLVGILAALSWSVKQSFGAFYLLSLLIYLLLRGISSRADCRRVATGTVALSAGFFVGVGLLLAWLWSQGALRDWYLQTVAFPREFYLQQLIAGRPGTRPSFWTAPVKFAQLQSEWPSWVVIRGVVLITALVQIVRRRVTDDLLLMAPITGFLWLGAYPSANFMHQWWTASLTIASFIVCMRRLVSRLPDTLREGHQAAEWVTAALTVTVIMSGVAQRLEATFDRARRLTETLTEPPLFRGIRTDRQTYRAIDLLYRQMKQYRARHSVAKVVSLESSDGWVNGVAASLPLLSFFENNTHRQPVYWSLPVLTTSVYPRYAENLWNQIRAEPPLIVDHQYGKYRQASIPGYFMLVAAQSDYGFWYLYAPDHENRLEHGEFSTFLANDGRMESGFVENDRLPTLTERVHEVIIDEATPRRAEQVNAKIEGAWRGRLQPSSLGDGTLMLSESDPLHLFDKSHVASSAPVNVYTWPADLREADLGRPVAPVSTDVSWRAGKGDIVREFGPGGITVDGLPPRPFAYLLQWREESVTSGASFLVRGELIEGGAQIGFLSDGKWSAYVNVVHPGPFIGVLHIERAGRYGLVLANCIQTGWWQRFRSDPINATLHPNNRGINRFRVSEAGWILPETFTLVSPTRDVSQLQADNSAVLR